ncbi:MAG: cytochrome c oxidase subunit II [Planctomycetaceae bacterium]
MNAEAVDQLYLALVGMAAFFTTVICVAIVYFVVRYRAGATVNRDYRPSRRWSLAVEIAWCVIPLVIAMIAFVWGADLYVRAQTPPDGALDVHVVGRQWMWKMQHAEGPQEINALHVPAGQPVRLVMISEDVIHSFYVPAFRVKQDVLPGRFSTAWFEARDPGTYHLFCAEYCGTDHSGMIGRVVVLPPADYAEWVGSHQPREAAEAAGQRLFWEHRCDSCHLVQGVNRAPALNGVYGSVVPLEGGATVIADDAYLRESVLRPEEKTVAGFKSIMPSYQDELTEEQILQIIAWMKSLREQ